MAWSDAGNKNDPDYAAARQLDRLLEDLDTRADVGPELVIDSLSVDRVRRRYALDDVLVVDADADGAALGVVEGQDVPCEFGDTKGLADVELFLVVPLLAFVSIFGLGLVLGQQFGL